MANVTISIDDELLRKSREAAAKQGLSLNALIRQMLGQMVEPSGEAWAKKFMQKIDAAKGDSKGWKWKRAELYED